MTAESSDVLARMMSERLKGGDSGGADLFPFIEHMIKQRSKNEDSKRRLEMRRMKRLNLEVNGLREWLRYFANMFGACPHCLGQSEKCPLCGGVGEAGYFPPDEEALGLWLEPAIKRLNMKLVVGDTGSGLTAKQ